MRRTGAKHLSLFQCLGIILSILGMLLALAPLSTRPARSTLRQMGRLRIALAALHVAVPSTYALPACPSPSCESTCEPSQDQQESDQESHDTESLTETLAWSEAITDRRAVQGNGVGAATALGSLAKPSRAPERTRSALQRSRVLPLLAADASGATTRLCRFTC